MEVNKSNSQLNENDNNQLINLEEEFCKIKIEQRQLPCVDVKIKEEDDCDDEDDFIKGLNQLHTRKLNDLEIGKEYKVNEFRTIQTRNGKTCVANIETDEQFEVFLPERYKDIPSRQTNKCYMIYNGLKQMQSNSNNMYHDITFK